MGKSNAETRRRVEPCSDHLGGKLGEYLFKFLIREAWIKKSKEGRDYDITGKGWQELQALGIDMEKIRTTDRKVLSPCVERHCGRFYEHAGAYFGALIAERFFELGWLAKKEDKRYEITTDGLKGLRSLGIELT